MDIKREGVAKRKRIKFAIYSVVLLSGVSYGGWRISKLEPAAPSVEFATLWPDTVKRGPMVRDMKGIGSLVPEDTVWIPAKSSGQVVKLLVKSGQAVKPDTVLVVLNNPDLELEVNDYEWQVKQAEANYADLKVRLQSALYDQRAAVTRTETAQEQATKTQPQARSERHRSRRLSLAHQRHDVVGGKVKGARLVELEPGVEEGVHFSRGEHSR